MLEIRLLGTFEIRCDGAPVTLPSRAAQSLFAYLLLNAGTAHRREKLAGLFWPDSPEERARASLRHELWRIRKALGSNSIADVLMTDEMTVAFDASADYWLDAKQLERLGQEARTSDLIQGLSVYRGELLPGFYDDWLVLEREHLQFVFERHLARLLDLLEAENRWAEMAEWGERWLALGQNPDAAYRSLMVAYQGLGDRAKVLATYERCVQALGELGLEPSPEIRALAEIKQPATNLPTPMTSFIGRQRELREVGELLLTGRLVTLTGAGGVGKTRLAIETAHSLANRFEDGVYYLELAPVQDPATVPERLVGLLQVHGTTGKSQSVIERLTAHFRSRHALIVLDNCEHLLEACAELAGSLLRSCPDLHVLSTSREPLRLPGETAFRVPSMELPSSDDMAELATLAECASIRLFVERARARSTSFTLRTQNARLVAEICIRLDGIPLAIELAAARSSALPLESMLEHLDDRFALLAGGVRSDIPRHQTLRAMIDWSYDLLSDAERVLLRRLAVFAGGWTLRAAEEVAGIGVLEGSDVLRLLPELVDKSLVLFSEASSRYAMLETIREYSLDRLKEAGEEALLRSRHLDYFVVLASSSHLDSSEGEPSYDALAKEHENLVAAIKWSEAAEGCAQKGLQLMGDTRTYWILSAQYQTAYQLTKDLLALPGAAARNLTRCRALLTVAQAAYFLGCGADLRWAAEESLSIARELGDRRHEAEALDLCGFPSGLVAEAGHREEGFQYLEDALRLATDLGMRRLVASVQLHMAEVLRENGQLAAAESLYEQAVIINTDLNAYRETMICILNLSSIAIASGDLPRARQRLLEVFNLLDRLPYGITQAVAPLLICSCFLAANGKWKQAALAFGAAEQQRELENRITEPADQLFIESLVEQTCQALGPAEFQALSAEGRRLPIRKAVAQAKDWLTSQNPNS